MSLGEDAVCDLITRHRSDTPFPDLASRFPVSKLDVPCSVAQGNRAGTAQKAVSIASLSGVTRPRICAIPCIFPDQQGRLGTKRRVRPGLPPPPTRLGLCGAFTRSTSAQQKNPPCRGFWRETLPPRNKRPRAPGRSRAAGRVCLCFQVWRCPFASDSPTRNTGSFEFCSLRKPVCVVLAINAALRRAAPERPHAAGSQPRDRTRGHVGRSAGGGGNRTRRGWAFLRGLTGFEAGGACLSLVRRSRSALRPETGSHLPAPTANPSASPRRVHPERESAAENPAVSQDLGVSGRARPSRLRREASS